MTQTLAQLASWRTAKSQFETALPRLTLRLSPRIPNPSESLDSCVAPYPGAILKGKAPKLSSTQRTVLLKLHGAGEHSIAELAELFSVSRATVYREIARPGAKKPVTGVR